MRGPERERQGNGGSDVIDEAMWTCGGAVCTSRWITFPPHALFSPGRLILRDCGGEHVDIGGVVGAEMCADCGGLWIGVPPQAGLSTAHTVDAVWHSTSRGRAPILGPCAIQEAHDTAACTCLLRNVGLWPSLHAAGPLATPHAARPLAKPLVVRRSLDKPLGMGAVAHALSDASRR